ncbi:MAG: LamB/YcsF family protein, partial [Oscillospiraceae bacterium]|nr:LamB/YcsF family protein [Oscillospiraceae bacterium]
LAMAIAEAIASVDKDIILLGLANSKMIEAGKAVGLKAASEVFADRAYQADGSLVPRSKPGAVIHDKDEAIARTVRMVTEGKVTAITGEEVSIEAHSICVHGDNPSAVEFVKNIRAELTAKGIEIAPISAIV